MTDPNDDKQKSQATNPDRELDAGENGELGSSGDMGATEERTGGERIAEEEDQEQ